MFQLIWLKFRFPSFSRYFYVDYRSPNSADSSILIYYLAALGVCLLYNPDILLVSQEISLLAAADDWYTLLKLQSWDTKPKNSLWRVIYFSYLTSPHVCSNKLPTVHMWSYPHFTPFSLLKYFCSSSSWHIGALCHYMMRRLLPLRPSALLKSHILELHFCRLGWFPRYLSFQHWNSCALFQAIPHSFPASPTLCSRHVHFQPTLSQTGWTEIPRVT